MVNDSPAWDLGHKTQLGHKCCEDVWPKRKFNGNYQLKFFRRNKK